MNIHAASITDIEQCQRLDASFATEHVWQMTETNAPGTLGASFRRIHIPRHIEVGYPRSFDGLREDWERDECFLVADELGRVLAFLDMTVCRWQWQGRIEHLASDRHSRRQGLATRLLAVAEAWARQNELRAISIALQTKNDPAISLFSERGYSFCGYADHYYNNGDVGLLFRLNLLGSAASHGHALRAALSSTEAILRPSQRWMPSTR